MTLPVLDVAGDPHRRGLDHGRAFAASVRANIETYLSRFEASGLSREAAVAEGAAWDAAIGRTSPDYAAEMRGVAEGAGLEPAVLALLNARYEIAFTLFGRDARAPDRPATEPSGCTTFGALPEVTGNGHTWLGQNWDWLASIRGHCLVLRVRRKGAPGLVCLTEAGIVGGKMGVNEAGIGLVENGLASDRDGCNPYEKPFHVRCREALEAETLHDAMLPIVQTRRVCSANFVLGTAGGEIIDLETSPDLVTALHPKDGLVTHANHFLDPRHGISQMERIGPSTLFRAARLERQLRRHAGRLGLAEVRAAFADHLSHPNAICRHPDSRQPQARRTMTLASVVVDCEARELWVAEGPPCESEHHCFGLAAEAALARAG